MREIAIHWIEHYEYAGIFSLLAFGIVGLPVPDEWLLTFSGYLISKQKLALVPGFVAAFLGSASGITVSYSLGRVFDAYVLEKYGRILHVTPERLARVHVWFERRGRWTLLAGYFIPGVRHLTGYVAGVSELRFRVFALFAYTGAFCWAAVFITLGYFLGEEWDRVIGAFNEKRLFALLITIAAVAAYAAYSYFRKRRLKRA
jgi:membrane protein DedA with SNARE-associated domain